MLQSINTSASLLDFCCHQLTGFLHLSQSQHIGQYIRKRFYRSVQITGRECETIGIYVIGIRCPCLIVKNRNIYTHNVLHVFHQRNFLFRCHQSLAQSLLGHTGLGNDKVDIGLSDPFFHFQPECHVFADKIQEFAHKLIALILQKSVALDGRDQLGFKPRQLHSGWIYLFGCQVSSLLS